jgi:hypothetical protein
MVRTLTREEARRLIDAPPDARIRIHTYQDERVVERARARGHFAGDPEHSSYPEAYDWMVGRMAALVPDFSGELPMWAWAKRLDGRPKYLSQIIRPPGQVRITALVPRRRILVSDLDMWNAALNEHAIHLDETQEAALDERWAERPTDPAERAAYMDAIRPTWDLMLDPLADFASDWWGDRRDLSLQLCVDRIMLDEVVSIRHYDRPLGRRKP